MKRLVVLAKVIFAIAALSSPALAASLKVSSFPSGAQVVIDGTPTGKVTPMSTALSVGDHAVTVQIPGSGWQPDTRTVTIVEGNNDLSVTLLPALTQGPKGEKGDAGPAGADGKTVRNGTVPPPSGVGVEGDFYLDSTMHILYGPKTQSGWGSGTSLIGPQGPAGAQGAPGTNVLTGVGAPAPTTGADGDSYLDSAAGQIYGPKTAGQWGSPRNLVSADTDKLDGLHSSAFASAAHNHDASSINTGLLSTDRYSAYADLTAEGKIGMDNPDQLLTVGNANIFYNTFQWLTASADVSALPNTGYVANSAQMVTITLPLSTSLSVGNTIRVSGAGAGGWKIAQNAGQKIRIHGYGVLDYSKPWTARESNRSWQGVASSADGTKLVAFVGAGQIYTSSDSGVTWTARESNRNWYSVASSSDGTKLVACVWGGQIYTSSDSGVNWTAREPNRQWFSVASSSDGTKLVACVWGGQIYTSSDSGVTWTARAFNQQWLRVASSADGTKLVACVNFYKQNGQLYMSSDSGVTWTLRDSTREWQAGAFSSDGTKLVVCARWDQIYTSSDSGVTLIARESNREWLSVASSADGTKLVACVGGGQIYTSSDSGVNWTARADDRLWYSVASSADGTKLVAVCTGQIYTLDARQQPIPETITGAQYDAVELQYVGTDTFIVLSHEGSLGAQ